MRRFILSFLVSLVFLTSFQVPLGRAAPTDPEDLKWMIVSKIKGFNTALDNKYMGQYGLLYNLQYLALATRWTEFMVKAPSLHFSSEEKKIYEDALIDNYSAFNKKYSKDSGIPEGDAYYYRPLKLKVGTGGEAGFKSAIKSFMNEEVPEYLDAFLADLNEEYGKPDTNLDEFMTNNKDNMRFIYSTLMVLTQEQNEMRAMLGIDTLTVSNDPTSVLLVSLPANAIIQKPEYKELLDKGRSLSEDESIQVGNVGYEEASTYIAQLAWVTPKKSPEASSYDVDLWEPVSGHGSAEDFKLRDTYVAMIEATAVYKPFTSHVGDKEYLDTLAYLTSGDKDKSRKILALFNQIKDFRKPLYVIDDAGWWDSTFGSAGKNEATFPTYAGSGRRLTLKEFLKRVDDEEVSGFVTVRGDFRQVAEDGNSWAFYQENSKVDWKGMDSQQGSQGTQEQEQEQPADDATKPDADKSEPADDQGGDPGSYTPPAVSGAGNNSVLTMADEVINTTKWTSTVLEFGYKDGYPITGLAVLKNFMKYDRQAAKMANADTRSVFMNAFGDIVTEDNTVIVPAAANPMLYDEDLGYNPYTVAFMNGYPTVYAGAGNKLKFGSSDDKGKFLLMGEGDKMEDKHIFIKVQGDNNLAISHAKQPIKIYRGFVDVGQGKMEMLSRSNAGVPGWWEARFGMLNFSSDSMKAMTITSGLVKNVPVFPYDINQDYSRDIRNLIAYNMYWSYINSSDGSATANFNGRLREDYIFRNILVAGMGGSIYASAYNKNMAESLEALNDDGYSWFKKNLVKFGKDLLESLGKIDGVLGLKNRYQDPILGKFLIFIQDYFWYVLAAMAVVFLIKFLRQNMNVTGAVLYSGLSAIIIFAFLKIIPVYLPLAYNVAVNNISTNLAYQITATKAEKYNKTYSSKNQLDDKGKLSISTTSMNLFKLSDKDIQTVADRYNLRKRDLLGGKITMLDTTNGIYLEGDTLKVNIDSLMANNPIVGSYGEDNESSYSYKADKMYSSVLDYYTPYYQIEDGFVETLNNLLTIYNIPKHSTKYAEGLEKDSFVVYSYVNSIPFLYSDNMEDATDQTTPQEMEKLKSVFKTPNDFLNLHKFLSNPTPEMKETLWYKTMLQNGFFADNDESRKKYSNFISDVNYQVKKFLIDIKPQVGMISDENLIKMVSIYATTIFNQKASEYANWLYPFSLNYQEFSMQDVMLASVTDDYSRFIVQDMDVVSYIANYTDPFTLLVFYLDLVFSFLISLIIKFLVPVLYITIGLLLLGRFITGHKLSTALSGYTKVSLIIFVCLTGFVTVLGSAMHFNIYIVVYGMLLCFGLILYVLSQVLSSVIFNITEMGNSKLNEKLNGLLERTHLDGKVGKLKAKIGELRNRNDKELEIGEAEVSTRYKLNASVIEVNDDPNDTVYVRRAMQRQQRRARVTEQILEARNEDRDDRKEVNTGTDFTFGAM